MDDSKENRLKRLYVTICAMLILLAYTGYIVFRKLKFGEVSLDSTDYIILGTCLAIMLAVEAVKYYIRKKSGISNDKK